MNKLWRFFGWEKWYVYIYRPGPKVDFVWIPETELEEMRYHRGNYPRAQLVDVVWRKQKDPPSGRV